MKVTMLQSVQLLGTSIVLNKGETYEAFPATNQPDYEALKLYFVMVPGGDDSVLCKLNVDMVISREEWAKLRYRFELQEQSELEGGGWMAWIPLLGKGMFMLDGDTAAEAIEKLEKHRIEMYDMVVDKVATLGCTIPMPRDITDEECHLKTFTEVYASRDSSKV